MKRQILLLVTAIILCSFSYGQVTRESFDKAVDILNYQSVYYSLSVLSPASGVTAKFKSNCACENNPVFESIKSSIPVTEAKTIEISNEIQELKTQDISGFTQQRALDFLLNDIFEQYQSLKEYKDALNQKEKLSDFNEIISQKLGGVLVEKNQPTTSGSKDLINELSKIEERIQRLEVNLNSKEDKSGFLAGILEYLVILAIVIIVSGLGFIFALRNKIIYKGLMPQILESTRLKRVIQDQNSLDKNRQTHHSSTSEITVVKGEIRELNLQISELHFKIQKLTEPDSIQSAISSNQEKRQKEPTTEILFLSTPNSDGSFNESSASNTYRDGASIYRLTKTGSVNAKFKVDEKETSIKLAMQYPDKNIDPVCDAENAFNPKATRISTIKMGDAELQNGKWVITSKAVIRYED